MLKKIFTNYSVRAGLVLYVVFTAAFLWFQLSIKEALIAALALTLVVIGVERWRGNLR